MTAFGLGAAARAGLAFSHFKYFTLKSLIVSRVHAGFMSFAFLSAAGLPSCAATLPRSNLSRGSHLK